MQLYNTRTQKKEEFIPHEAGKVKMYTCGPTVYHYAHIGNLRSYIMEDMLEKAFQRCRHRRRQDAQGRAPRAQDRHADCAVLHRRIFQ